MGDVESLFLRQRKRERDLLRRPDAYELTEIIGVVHPTGVGGAHAPLDKHWRLSFELLAWRRAAQPVQRRSLLVVKQAREHEIRPAMAEFEAYSVFRLSVRLADPGRDEEPVALLLESLGRDLDREMNHAAEELQRPVTFEHRLFGVFVLDRRANCFEARVPWGAGAVTLSLSMDWRASVEDQLRRAVGLWADREAWYQCLLAFMVADLLPLKNSAWLDDGQPPLGPDEFLRALKPDAILIEHDGRVDFWFEDGDLFWGHSIVVHCSPTGEPTDVDVAG